MGNPTKPEHERVRAINRMPGLPGTVRRVLIEIAHYDGPGGAWPSQETIGDALGLSARRVREAIKTARGLGVVTAKKRQRTSVYEIAYGLRPAENPSPDRRNFRR